MGKQTPMGKDAAARMQSVADRREDNEDDGDDASSSGFRRGGPSWPASDVSAETNPWVRAFASLIGVPI